MRIPNVGAFVPGYINGCNSPGQTGQQDAQGNNIPTPMVAGNLCVYGVGEINQYTVPGTELFDGAYQWVKTDSGANATYMAAGQPAFIVVDSGANIGANVRVTTQGATGATQQLLAGVFINAPAYPVTPGNWCFIFVGAGRVNAQISSGGGNSVVGNQIFVNSNTPGDAFHSQAPATINPQSLLGTAVQSSIAPGPVLTYVPNILYRIPN